jgi:hypothetical protein
MSWHDLALWQNRLESDVILHERFDTGRLLRQSFRPDRAKAVRLAAMLIALSTAFSANFGLLQLRAQDTARGLADKTRERLLADWKVLETWDETERSYQTQSETVLTDGKKRPAQHTVKVRPDERLMINSRGVIARSHAYTFALSLPTPTTDGVLSYFSQEPLSPESHKNLRGMLSATDYFSLYPLSTLDSDRRVSEAVAEPDFIITQVTSGTNSIDKIEYQFKRGAESKFKSGIGYFLVDRAKSSLVMENHYRGSAPGVPDWTVDFTRELYPSADGHQVPRCKSIEFVMRDALTKALENRQKVDFSDYSDARVSAEEFRLSHYGMPEPIGVEWKKPTPNYVWLLVGAGVLAALALGFHYLARRYRAGQK